MQEENTTHYTFLWREACNMFRCFRSPWTNSYLRVWRRPGWLMYVTWIFHKEQWEKAGEGLWGEETEWGPFTSSWAGIYLHVYTFVYRLHAFTMKYKFFQLSQAGWRTFERRHKFSPWWPCWCCCSWHRHLQEMVSHSQPLFCFHTYLFTYVPLASFKCLTSCFYKSLLFTDILYAQSVITM